MDRVIGTCSICGGDVVEPDVQFSVVPVRPRCVACAAVSVQAMPVIRMEPVRPRSFDGSPWA